MTSINWGDAGWPVSHSADIERVAAIPRRAPPDLDGVEGAALVSHEMSKWARPSSSCNCMAISGKPCIRELLPIQAWVLYELAMYGGVVGSVTTGAGKSLCGVLAPLALGLGASDQALIFVPANVVEQFEIDYLRIANHFLVPGLIVHRAKGKGGAPPRRVPGMPTLHVLPYSLLSGTENSDWLVNLRPKAIIADEADSLKDTSSTRVIRVLTYFKELGERLDVRFACWTGSITDKALSEFAHLMILALRENAPVPLDPTVTEDWGRHLDAVDWPCPAGALATFCEPGEDTRRAYHRRLAETPGVIIMQGNPVISGGEEVRPRIREREAPPLPPIIVEALKKVREFKRPDSLANVDLDDEELESPMDQARCAHEVVSGLSYYWHFPRGESRATIDEWLASRKLWNKEVRLIVTQGQRHLDSPKLVENAARRALGEIAIDGKPVYRAENWVRWSRVKDLVKPETRAYRLSSYLVEDAIEWAMESPGIVWYTMSEFARWMSELSGLPMHEGGEGAGQRLARIDGKTSIICSVKSHGRGRDGLQFKFNRQLVAQMLSSSAMWQQLLARLLRRGQESLVVTTDVYLHVPELQRSFSQALRRAKYVRDLLGETQTLLSGFDDVDSY